MKSARPKPNPPPPKSTAQLEERIRRLNLEMNNIQKLSSVSSERCDRLRLAGAALIGKLQRSEPFEEELESLRAWIDITPANEKLYGLSDRLEKIERERDELAKRVRELEALR